jgi:uncharacterized protein YecA (UPF0149 family)
MVLTCFASRELAQRYVGEADEAELTFEKFAALMPDLVPNAMREYAHIGRTAYDALNSAEKEQAASPHADTEPKPGRNEPCPCGSGKKYKRCHGAN